MINNLNIENVNNVMIEITKLNNNIKNVNSNENNIIFNKHKNIIPLKHVTMQTCYYTHRVYQKSYSPGISLADASIVCTSLGADHYKHVC